MAEGRDNAGRFVAGAAHPRMGGRHKSPRRIEAILQRIGEEELVHQGQTITKLEAVLRAVFGYALKGQSWAVQFIAERTEGKVRDQIQADVEVVRAIKIIDYDGDPTPQDADETTEDSSVDS